MPAYGRRYNTEQEVKDDWNAGKDFKIIGGPYISNRDKINPLDSLSYAFGNVTVYLQLGILP